MTSDPAARNADSWFRRTPPAAPPHGLRVHADFEGGNVAAVSVASPAHVLFSARADSSPRPLWFHFCLEGTTAPAVRCDLRNADQCLGPRHGWRTVRPVFSPDGRHWERVARAEYVEEATDFGYFGFTVPTVGRRTYVAYCYPYGVANLEATLAALPVSRAELCRSRDDRPVVHLRLGNHANPRRTVWVIARQHSGESPASFVAEGLLRTLGQSASIATLADTAYHVIPMLDVDGVVHGRYGKDQEPVDFNRDWREHPVRPEVTALVRALRASRQQAPVELVLDLHAPHHGDMACYAFGSPAGGDPAIAQLQRELLSCIAVETPPAVGLRPEDLRTDSLPERSCREYVGRVLGVPTLTFEISYHLAQSGRYLTQADYRDLGAAILRGTDRYFSQRTPKTSEVPSERRD